MPNNETININNAATFLRVSIATVRNWVKSGILIAKSTKPFLFELSDIKKLKKDIENGTINRLNKRANKSHTKKTFLPKEYLLNHNANNNIELIIKFIQENKLYVELSLFLLALNLLKKENLISEKDANNIYAGKLKTSDSQVKKELLNWIASIDVTNKKDAHLFLLNCELQNEIDLLGLIYQSLKKEGDKSKGGSYYTPISIIHDIVNKYASEDTKIFDPCCGTGQFLLAFADKIKNPENLFGYDIDQTAVRIARINLLLKYKDINFNPSIYCKNFLFENLSSNDFFGGYNIIATNPPWGVHFSSEESTWLKKEYNEICSGESFSYFLKKSIDLLKDNVVLSFILPASILNVKTHRDIRKIILEKCKIKNITHYGKIFENVFAQVIRLDITKSKTNNHQTEINIVKGLATKENSFEKREQYKTSSLRWLNNRDYLFDIYIKSQDAEIIDKVFSVKHHLLFKQADWILGIVTGNNKKFISTEPKDGFEPIYTGKDIDKLIFREPSNYILLVPEKFQQVASIEKYRIAKKLIYRFISNKLIFAYDDKQRLTLNSANSVIPKIPNYPIKVIAALLNSSIYNFIFQKKFASIKVLRHHIESLPIPIWDNSLLGKIEEMANNIINRKENFYEIDKFIMNQFLFSLKEQEYIKSVVGKK